MSFQNLSFSNVRNEGAVLNLLAGTDLVADASGVNAVGEPAEEVGNIIITNQLVGASGATTNVIASDTLSVGNIKNAYNLGNINGALYAGGIVGTGASVYIDSCYNIFSNYDKSSTTGNIIGGARGVVIKNCYYLVDTGKAIGYDDGNNRCVG